MLRTLVKNNSTRFVLFLGILQTLLAPLGALESQGVFLTWQDDPSTTMTIQWITGGDDEDSLVHYRVNGSKGWSSLRGQSKMLPNTSHRLHSVELTELEASTAYQFKLSDDRRKRLFRTVPKDLTQPLRFIVGGDIYHGTVPEMTSTHEKAADFDPYFAVAGGDIAYSADSKNAGIDHFSRWLDFFQAWEEYMVTKDGFMIPIVPAIGNHEVLGRYGQPISNAKYFYAFFPFPGKTGRAVFNVGDYMSLIVLDSGHTHSIAGEQKEWLKAALKEQQVFPHRFAVYHVPAYPCVRRFTKRWPTQVRKHWTPLFERYKLHVAFENHEHGYKRTHPMKGGSKHPKGVLYLGDGGWGAQPRKIKDSKDHWYLAKTAARRHVIGVEIGPKYRRYFAIDGESGEIFDSYEQILD